MISYNASVSTLYSLWSPPTVIAPGTVYFFISVTPPDIVRHKKRKLRRGNIGNGVVFRDTVERERTGYILTRHRLYLGEKGAYKIVLMPEAQRARVDIRLVTASQIKLSVVAVKRNITPGLFGSVSGIFGERSRRRQHQRCGKHPPCR